MQWIHVKAVFEAEDVMLAEELISDVFFTFDLQGVVCQVPLEPPSDGFGHDALPINEETSISGYIPHGDQGKTIVQNIRDRAMDIQTDTGGAIRIDVQTEIVDQEDWAEAWKRHFHVERITDRIVVKPAWRTFTPTNKDVVIEIDPGMAFGTGTHPTTAMCIALIEKYLKPGDRFFDVGTGSGILMIAAAKLGAASLDGIDTDAVAVSVALENLEKNRIDPAICRVEKNHIGQFLESRFSGEPGGRADDGKGFDLVVANILAEVLVAMMPDLKQSLMPRGKVILSGIILERETDVADSVKACGMEIVEVIYEGEWVALAATPCR